LAGRARFFAPRAAALFSAGRRAATAGRAPGSLASDMGRDVNKLAEIPVGHGEGRMLPLDNLILAARSPCDAARVKVD
jgi:hypothetical protein